MTKRKVYFLFILLTAASLVFTACDTSQEAEALEDNQKKETLSLTHSLGEVEVDVNPKKVVVFDYGTLDTLDTLGVDILGLPKSNIPRFLEKFEDEKYQDVGTLQEPNFEKIFELEPDVIFISTRQAEAYDQLSKIAPTVYIEIDGTDFMGSITKNFNLLGEIFDKEDLVQEQLTTIDQRIEELNTEVRNSNKNGLVVLSNDGVVSAYGKGSRFGIIHGDFGFTPSDENIEVSNHGQSITFEYILEKNPDYIFVVDRAAVTGGSVSAKQLFDNDIIKQTDAYQNNTIVYLNSEIWYVASGGMTGTMEMIEDIKAGL